MDARQLPDLLCESPFGRPELRVVAVSGEVVEGAAFGSLSPGSAGHGPSGHVDLIVVAEKSRLKGIGGRLLSTLEGEVVRAGASQMLAGDNRPCYAWPGVDVRYTPAICLLESRGYMVRGQPHMNMTVDLGASNWGAQDDEEELALSGVTVSRAAPDGGDGLVEWVGKEWGDSWSWQASRCLRRGPVSCHIAMEEGRIIGFACHGANRSSWFGPTGVAQSARRRGIGGVLLKRCLADQRAAGLRYSEIGWVGPVKFYSRTAGAFLERACQVYYKDLA